MLDMTAFGERLVEVNLAIPTLLRGCSEAEVAALEEQAGGRLPEAYRAFLRVMGKEAGNLFRGTDMFYSDLSKLRGWAENLLAEQGHAGELPADAFVFSLHQGYEAMYFRRSEGDDPPVYQFAIGMEAPVKAWDSFSAFLEDGVAQHLKVRAEMWD